MVNNKDLNRNRLWFMLPFVILSLLIFILSHQSKIKYPELGIEWEDKILHALAFCAYGISIIMAISAFKPELSYKKAIFFVILIGLIFGISDEIHQYFIPGRDSSIYDWFADCIGVFASLVFYKTVANKIKKYLLK